MKTSNNIIDFYNKIKDWDFSNINSTKENYTRWKFNDLILEYITTKSRVLDIGTGGGERVLKHYPECQEIVGTDLSEEMIKTANKNLSKTKRKEITFRIMDNLKMDVPLEYFDVVTARHTIIDAKQIYDVLKPGGVLILRGVDQLDCWHLKRIFNKGQAYTDLKPISLVDYENILDAGFTNVELVPIHAKEYMNTKEDLVALLLKTPILIDYSETKNLKKSDTIIDDKLLDKYIELNTSEKGILLIRRFYGIVATK